MPYAVTVFKLVMRYENASAILSHVPTYQIYGFQMIDAILIIFPPCSAIPSASGESNPFRLTLRYSAAIFRDGFNLESAIPLVPNAFAAFVSITTMSAAIAPSPATSDTTRWAGSVMDSTGRRIAAEMTVDTIPFPIA